MKDNEPRFRLLYAAPGVARPDGEGADKDYPKNYEDEPDPTEAREMEDVYNGPDFFGDTGAVTDDTIMECVYDGPEVLEGRGGGDADYPQNNAEPDDPEDPGVKEVYAGPRAPGFSSKKRGPFMGRVYAGPGIPDEEQKAKPSPKPKRRPLLDLFKRKKTMQCVYAGPEMMSKRSGGDTDDAADERTDKADPKLPTGSELPADDKLPEGGRKTDRFPRMEAVYACPPPGGRERVDKKAMEGVYAGPKMMRRAMRPDEPSMMAAYAGPQVFSDPINGQDKRNGVFVPAFAEQLDRHCPVCGFKISQQARFCENCGAPTPREEQPEKPAEQAGGENKTVCSVCGSEIREGMSFCPECGALTEKPERVESAGFRAVYAAPGMMGRRPDGMKPKKVDPADNKNDKREV